MRVLLTMGVGCFGLLLLLGGAGTLNGPGNPVWIVVGLVLLGAAAYIFRGKGAAAAIDTWDAMQSKRREDESKRIEDQKTQRMRARADFVATILGRAPAPTGSSVDTIAAAQISAIANPETARSIQNLQNLLYTQAITDQEFQAAKDRLLRSGGSRTETDATAQVMKLAELHQAGVLSDVEFNAAKLRALGLG